MRSKKDRKHILADLTAVIAPYAHSRTTLLSNNVRLGQISTAFRESAFRPTRPLPATRRRRGIINKRKRHEP